MGYLKQKYTEAYYTGKNSKGKKLNYGATSALDKNGNYILREHDEIILSQVDFKEKNVLALGCGRGEELAYAIENHASSENMVGVDFSSAAVKIAKKLIKNKNLSEPTFYVADALDFVSEYKKIVKENLSKKFDIVIMFDFVEHVPREELIKIFGKLKSLIKEKAILVINTPAYKYDNDVIKNGYDERNQINTFDTSDLVPETRGMHCNKYSLVSLQQFMDNVGFINVTESHYFVSESSVPKDFNNISYYDRWKFCKINNFPLLNDYKDDVIEDPYQYKAKVELIEFNTGILEGISLYTTRDYQNVAYPDGNTDLQMMNDIKLNNPFGKTIFDIGTFVGSSCLAFSKLVGKKGKVYGFEPNPFNRNRAFLNLSKNKTLSENILITPYGIGNSNERKKMTLSSEIDNGYSSTSRLEGTHPKLHNSDLPEGFEDIFVEVRTLDAFVKENKVIPDILKVDIEGAEYDLLLGAIGTIRKYHPILYIEIHSEFCAIRCFEILSIEGYSVSILNEELDNRIMIKASYAQSKKKNIAKDRELQILRNEDVALNCFSYVKDFLEPVKSNLTILQYNFKDLEKYNNELKQRNLELEEKICKIESINSALERSKSWRITKPLRSIARILKKTLKF